MGLAISVYKDVTKSDQDNCDAFKVRCDHEELMDRMSNLEIGSYYTGEESEHEFSYPYSYHKIFREFLLNFINKDWDTIQVGDPFYEFIIFYDDMGCIDWKKSEKLYKDFENNIKSIHQICSSAKTFAYSRIYYTYLNWLEAFKIASENKGVVLYS